MHPHPNDIVGDRYRIDSELGRGGFATVFAVTDMRTQRSVALKVLDESFLADSQARRRFEREAKILEQLRNPHIVQLLDHAPDEVPFLVFELLDGEDLARRLQNQQRMSLEETIRVLRQLLDALGAAHSGGILHRDIKPENVRVMGAGSEIDAKLFDFGIARPSDDGSPSVTATGELVGTPRYMSPEQLTGQRLTAASDIYSAGLVAFEMLLGRDALHGGGWNDQLERLQTGHVFALPGLDEQGVELIGILRRMTAREPGDRFGSAQAVLYALDTDDSSRRRVIDPDRAPPPRWWPAFALFVLVFIAASAWVVSKQTTPPPPQVPARGVNASALIAGEARTPALPERPATAAQRTDAGSAPPWATSGCGQPVPRHTTAYVPNDYDNTEPHPVVIVLRDQYTNTSDLLTTGRFAELADRERLIVLTPARELTLDAQLWREVPEMTAMVVGELQDAMATYCIDPGRVFVLGIGGGGGPAHRMSCLPWITGVATYAHNTDKTWCNEPKPFLLLYPTKSKHQRIDDSVPHDQVCERVVRKYYVDHVADWKSRNRCDKSAPWPQPGATCTEFDCEASLITCAYDGGRGWPGVPRTKPLEVFGINEPSSCDGPAPDVFDPLEAVWTFFNAAPNTPRENLEPGITTFLE